jgi:replicative DNA helicase
MGKTALALNFSQNLAKNGKNIIIFSLEMSRDEIIDRLVSAHTGIDQRKFHNGSLSDYEFGRIADAMEELSKASIYIDDSPSGITLPEIKSKAKRMIMQQ